MSAKAGTSRVTTLPAPTRAYSPIVTPHTTVTLAPIDAPRHRRVGRYSFFRLMKARGFMTLVNTADGPTKTSSSRVTPSYIETLFWILHPLPIRAVGKTTTFCPNEQRLPTWHPDTRWQKCHIRVSSPMWHPSSMMADGWIWGLAISVYFSRCAPMCQAFSVSATMRMSSGFISLCIGMDRTSRHARSVSGSDRLSWAKTGCRWIGVG